MLCLLLTACLCCALALPATAAGRGSGAAAASGGAAKPTVVISSQKLSVNGRLVDCEKYNIDGANYFRLRDLALLLSGTECQFEVGWDGETNTVTVTSGKAYTPVGGELTPRGDLSAQTTPSTQKLIVNGKTVSGLSVYNIGGTNYFKLRDLGEYLGFSVDFDAAANTAKVASPDFTPDLSGAASDPLIYAPLGENNWYFLEPVPNDPNYTLIWVLKCAEGGGIDFYMGYLDSEILVSGAGSYRYEQNGTLRIRLDYESGGSAEGTYTLQSAGGELRLTQTSEKGLFTSGEQGKTLSLQKGVHP